MNTREFKQSNTLLRPGDPPLVKFWKVSKFFPGLIANNQIELDVFPGEIHAVIGENGAGKSTLMNILNGIYHPDEGELVMDGYGHYFSSPHDAIAAGIGMVHQHFKLVRTFTVTENLKLAENGKSILFSRKQLREQILELAKRFGFRIDPDTLVSNLSIGEQQQVEILKALFQPTRILVLDEPTAILTPQESQNLFVFLSEFRQNGNAVLFTSHKLDEVLQFSDTVSILRNGQKIATYKTRDCNAALLAQMMTGHTPSEVQLKRSATPPFTSTPFLHLSEVSVTNSQNLHMLHNITLSLYPGEIVGIAGITGNGQVELSHIVTGMLKPSAGTVLLNDRPIKKTSPKLFSRAGIGHISEERLHTSLDAQLNICQNLIMRSYDRPPIGNRFLFSPHRAYQKAIQIVKQSQAKLNKITDPVTSLSGGNQQKLVIFREMEITTSLLVAVYPSRGLDIRSIQQLHDCFLKLRQKNIGILLFSEDLDELLALSDRIGVLFQGKLMDMLPVKQATKEILGSLMGGHPIPSYSTDRK